MPFHDTLVKRLRATLGTHTLAVFKNHTHMYTHIHTDTLSTPTLDTLPNVPLTDPHVVWTTCLTRSPTSNHPHVQRTASRDDARSQN